MDLCFETHPAEVTDEARRGPEGLVEWSQE
jgi:hypothetical protein